MNLNHVGHVLVEELVKPHEAMVIALPLVNDGPRLMTAIGNLFKGPSKKQKQDAVDAS